MRTVAVVPAAGSAERFGGKKLLTPIDGEPLLDRTISALLNGGVAQIIVDFSMQHRLMLILEDIHWAREVLRDPERRVAADLDSLNPDTVAGDLGRIVRRYSLDGPAWQPFDPEPAPPAFAEAVPDPAAELANLPAPDVPLELPGMAHWLQKFAAESIDPWGLPVPAPEPPQDPTACPTPP